MFAIQYSTMVLFISVLWIAVRVFFALRQKRVVWKREAQLLLVYIALLVITRFTFCPFETVNGQIQPLLFDAEKAFPPHVNFVPFVHWFDYPELRKALLNLIGNTAMFIPIGVLWPIVFRKLDRPLKVIAAGVGLSLCIELLQLPFFDRTTDIDDLLLNSIGFLAGYGLYALGKVCCRAVRRVPQTKREP